MMDVPTSSRKQPIPETEEELVPSTHRENSIRPIPSETLSEQDIKNYDGKSRVENNNNNQKLARRLVVGLALAFLLFCATSFIMKILGNGDFDSIFKETLSVLQFSIFTFIGFLFGDKQSNSK